MGRGRVSKLVGAVAVLVMGLLSLGCGRSPAYEPEYPEGYVPPPPPLTSEELAARQQVQASASQDVAIGTEGGDEYSDTDPSALTEWRPVLEPHGTWVDDPTYGTVWVPSSAEVGADFQPYVTAGHWTYADDTSWVWVSDYDWGWVPFHYGRWVYLPGHGWSWIPGRRYAGAWVTWRTGPVGYGYIGWAPAPPAWYWYNGIAIGWSFGFYSHHHHYVYCPHDYVYHPHMHGYVVRGPGARVHDSRTVEYVPPQSAPGGGDRYLANPSVGGGDRVIAQPGVGGRVPATPTVARGPRPTEAGIKSDIVVPPPKAHTGLERAQAYATARSAIERGAAPPAQSRFAGAASPNAMPSSIGGAPPSGSSFAPTRPEGVARGAPSAVAPLPPRQSALPEYRSPSPYVTRPQPRFTPTPPAASPPRVAEPLPSYRSTPSWSSPSPSYRSSPPSVASPPSYRPSTPSWSSPSPSYRSSPPSVASPPSFRPSTPSFRSAPSAPSSTPSFRPSTPSFRSSPSVSSPRPSGGSIRSGAMPRRR